jgi:hypothetical protein
MPIYPGPGQATLLHANVQAFLFLNESIAAAQQSVAFQLERNRAAFYPWGAAFQVKFSGAPGAFEIDIQGSETDELGSYVSLGTITAVNSSNFGRYDMTPSQFPKYVNALMKTLTNAVKATLVVTR